MAVAVRSEFGRLSAGRLSIGGQVRVSLPCFQSEQIRREIFPHIEMLQTARIVIGLSL
jgi:hypothetical protein